MMRIVIDALGLALIAAAFGSLSRNEAWWVRMCDFPRLQLALGSVAVLVALAVLQGTGDGGWPEWLIGLALLGCTAHQLAVILPYTPLWPVEVKACRAEPGPRTLSLLVVNVLMHNRRSDRLFTLIRAHDPDLVLAVETDDCWCDRFAQEGPAFPYRIARPLANTYGMLLCSKLRLVEPLVRHLLKPEIPSIRTGVRLPSGDVVTLYAVHPEPPSPAEADSSLPRDAELVLVGREVARDRLPAIVAGDLNDVAWSHTSRLFRRISRLLDPRIGRGMFNSFHARYWPCRWPLDHIFVSEEFALRTIRRLPAFGSDHFPILIAVDFVPAAAALHDAPAPDADDRAEADAKLERVGIAPSSGAA